MRKPNPLDLRTIDWIDAAAERILPWMPPVFKWLLFIPFWLLLLVVCLTEYGLRLLFTPAKYWSEGKGDAP